MDASCREGLGLNDCFDSLASSLLSCVRSYEGEKTVPGVRVVIETVPGVRVIR